MFESSIRPCKMRDKLLSIIGVKEITEELVFNKSDDITTTTLLFSSLLSINRRCCNLKIKQLSKPRQDLLQDHTSNIK